MVFSGTFTIILRISRFLLGIRNWKLKVISLKTRVFNTEGGLRRPPQSKSLVSIKPPLLSLSEPQKMVTTQLLLKFDGNSQKKKTRFPFQISKKLYAAKFVPFQNIGNITSLSTVHFIPDTHLITYSVNGGGGEIFLWVGGVNTWNPSNPTYQWGKGYSCSGTVE